MSVLPTATEYLADRTNTVRSRAAASPSRSRSTRALRRSPQLPLALPLARRGDVRAPSTVAAPPAAATAQPPAFDALGAAGALCAGIGSAGTITRLASPDEGWPDALVQPGDDVLVACGATVAEGALAAVRLHAGDGVQLRRVHRSGELHLRLQPEDRSASPLIVRAADVELIGPVVTIVRRSVGESVARRRTA